MTPRLRKVIYENNLFLIENALHERIVLVIEQHARASNVLLSNCTSQISQFLRHSILSHSYTTRVPPYVARCLELSFMVGWVLLLDWLLPGTIHARGLILHLQVTPFPSNLQFAGFLNNICSLIFHNSPAFLYIFEKFMSI